MNIYKNESGYMQMLRDAMSGQHYPSRSGGVTKVFNNYISFDTLPIQTARPQGTRGCWSEMLMFMSGNADTSMFERMGYSWWTEHTSRDFLDSRDLYDTPEKSLGKSYSYQWRHPANDQLQELVDNLISDPFSRRMAVDLWCAPEQDQMPLLPCWYRSNWYVTLSKDGRKQLNMRVDSRSCDLLFGFWQAALQYAMLQAALVHMLGDDWVIGETGYTLLDAHVYDNQREYVTELLERSYTGKCKLVITKADNDAGVDQLLSYDYKDFNLVGYEPNRLAMTTPRPTIAI